MNKDAITFESPSDSHAFVTLSMGRTHVEHNGCLTDETAECLFIRTDFIDIEEDETIDIAKKDIPELIEFLQKQI